VLQNNLQSKKSLSNSIGPRTMVCGDGEPIASKVLAYREANKKRKQRRECLSGNSVSVLSKEASMDSRHGRNRLSHQPIATRTSPQEAGCPSLACFICCCGGTCPGSAHTGSTESVLSSNSLCQFPPNFAAPALRTSADFLQPAALTAVIRTAGANTCCSASFRRWTGNRQVSRGRSQAHSHEGAHGRWNVEGRRSCHAIVRT